MALDVIEIGVSIRKGLIFSIRTTYRSVRDHPFYWGLVFFFIFLYRFFPSLFGLLVSFSPVLVCTAALLGTLLSFGNPNIPEIEKDDERTREIASLKAAVVENDLVLQNDESFSAEAHVEKRGEVEENMAEEPMGLEEVTDANVSTVHKDMVFSTINDDKIMGRTFPIEEDPKEIPGEEQMIKEEREFSKAELVEKLEFHEEDLLLGGGSGASKDIDATYSIGWEKIETPRRKIDMPGGAFSIAQDLSWNHVKGHDESLDSDSDRAESSSPDASMADIMPMLHELHPLLESESSQLPLISPDGSAESEEEGENQEEEEDDDDEEEEEDEAQGTQGDGTKDVVTWTEDDQKNLMDLGTLELERNRRLETLIAKRRARKIMNMAAEKNLIDLDANDPPFSIAPILTRRNPFDIPYDSSEAMGLPPIPGSAPSVLLPRRNPFDLPYEPYEEKPNLTENNFQQEFIPFQPKDIHFRRHESFSLGVPLESKQRRQFRPYFVTEPMTSEGVEYSMFQRQWSEKSDSKVSSVPETESASSVADQEDHKTFAEEVLPQEGNLISHIDHAFDHVECENKLSEEVYSVEIDPEEKRAVEFGGIDIKGVNEEGRPMKVDSTSDYVECESQSSEELDSAEVYPEERRDFDVDRVSMNGVDEEIAREVELLPHHSGSVASFVEADDSGVHAVEEKFADSSSSSSEVREKLFHMETDEGSRDQELKRDDNTEGSNGSIRSSLTESDFNLRNHIMEGGDENQIKEPVYDSSPTEIEKTLSNMTAIQEALFYVDKGVVTSTPSISSDVQVEVSEVGSAPVLVDREDGKSVSYDESTMELCPGNEHTLIASSNLHPVDENESRSMQVAEISERASIDVGFSGVSQHSDGPSVPKTVVGEVSSGYSSSSLETELGEVGQTNKEVHLQLEQDQVSLSSFNEEVQHHDANLKADTMASSYSTLVSSEKSRSSESEKPAPLMDELIVHPFSDGAAEETQDSSVLLLKSFEEANIQAPENEDSSNFSTLTAPVRFPAEVSELESTTAPNDIKENVLVRIQSGEDSRVLENLEAIGPQVTKEEFSEEAEGIKEMIDDEILSELDTVGDFSVNELGLKRDQEEKKLSLEVQESLPGLQALGGNEPAEDIEADSDKLSKLEAVADSPNNDETRSTNFEVEEKFPEVAESTSESLDNANVDFKHIPDSVVEKSVVVESVESVPLPKETGVEFTEFELPNQDPNQIKIGPDLPVVEARLLEDTESAFKELNQESLHNKSMVAEAEVVPTDSGPVLDARLIEDIDVPPEKIHGVQTTVITESFHDKLSGENSEVGLTDTRPSEGDSSSTMTDELPVVEARSLEDIDLVLKQLQEGVQNPSTAESFHDEPTREKSDVGMADSGLSERNTDLTRTCSELPVVEATSLEDIDLVLKQLQEGVQNPSTAESFHDESTREKSDVGMADSGLSERNTDLTRTSSELPVVEATSLEDINLAFEQLHGGVQKPMAIESFHNKPTWEETEVEECGPSHGESEPTEISSELPVLEVKSVEDIDLAFKQLHGGDLDETILPESVDRPPVVVESHDMVETHTVLPVDDVKSLGLEVEAKEMETVNAGEASQEVQGTSESSSLSESAVRHKKAGSHKSSSSSDSSSSDSE